MYIVFLVVTIIIFLYLIVDGILEKKKPQDTFITEQMRIKKHLGSILFNWGPTIAVLIMCLIGGMSFRDIGLRQLNFQYNTWITVITLGLCGLACLFFLYQTIIPFISAKHREDAKKSLADDKRRGAIEMMPRTAKERIVFSFVALSAGICEEIFFRGFMVFLLQAIFPGIPIYLVILIPCIVFGFGHFYQGMQGVATTGLMGLVLMCLFIVSGSLIPGIIMHFLADFMSTFSLWEKKQKSNITV
jgi:membrane protease YdiL (CAAX protease family)